ncbi:MAG: isoaspartyl peptidase/L-asparaginase [Chloroflexota bacterium]
MSKPNILVHGGAWDWPDELHEAMNGYLRQATRVGWEILQTGGSALDAVEKAVNVLEDAPVFEAATGGVPNADGVLEMDALIVDGRSHNFGAVGAVQRVQYPISLARKVMEETDHCFFVGAGADQLAAKLGMPLVPNAQLITEEAFAKFKNFQTDGSWDTVGAVAIDANGNVAAATSTSGLPFKPAGRVGDSPLLGSGGYAWNGIGAAGATGKGENVMRLLLAKYACDKMAEGITAQQAGEAAIAYIDGFFDDSMSGLILVDANGTIGVAHSTPKIAIGWVGENGRFKTAMNGKPFQR